jgi:hypothetical protein
MIMKEVYYNNKYTRCYYSIIEKAKSRINEGYTEKHHIIPKSICIDSEKKSSNIVRLTAREHYIVHLLLPKMVISKDHYHKMICAQQWFQKLMTANHYEAFRIRHAKTVSYLMTGHYATKGARGPQKNPHGPMSEEAKASRRHPYKSKGKKKKPLSEEHKQKISKANIGKHSSPRRSRTVTPSYASL